eukprot:scaffold2830_cov131-Cylindrotheca_fusiformis.AAC.34
MHLVLRATTAFLLFQSAAAFQPPHVPRRTVELSSLLDEAYDVPSISQSYSRAASEAVSKASIMAKGVPKATEKVAIGLPKYDVPEAASRAEAANMDASSKMLEANAQVSSAVDEASSKVSDVGVQASSVVDEASARVSGASAQVTSAVDEFVKAAGHNFPPVKNVPTGLPGFKSFTSPLDPSNFPKIPPAQPLEPGKARSLIGYVREKIEDGSFSVKVPDAATMSDAKSKFALMVSNTYQLMGKEAPENIPALPDGSAGWIATAVVALVALGQRNAGAADAKAAMGDMVKKEALAVSEIAEQLVGHKSMEIDIQQLNKETMALSKELQAAKSKLTEKELALSKERLAAMDSELKLNRSIDQMQLKLKEASKRLSAIDGTINVESSSPNTPDDVSTEHSDPAAPSFEEVVVKEAPAPEKKKAKGKPKTVRVVKGASKGKMSPTLEETPAPPKKVVKGEKSPATKATVEEVETAKSAKSTTAKAAKGAKAENWSSLSQSTLTRKTVKQLTDYLSTKGVPTTGEDGKPLKKALLVEAIQSL